jgi:alkylhydroperoxidase family enzyme
MPRIPPPDYPAPTFEGPFGNLVRLIGPTPAGAALEGILRSAYSSEVLPERTLILIFSVVARTLECDLCEATAAQLLDARGVGPTVQREVLDTLGSPSLTPMENAIIPWARDTVWMPEQPARIQERSRPILELVGPTMFIEVVGGAALANACARLAMLET